MPTENVHLHGVVDIGSNGIRFSITDLSPATARTLPTLYQDRAGISLYDAQFPARRDGGETKRLPIPDKIIDRTVARLVRFRVVCSDFGVPAANVYILATEAVRTASNSREFLRKVREATDGGEVLGVLTKEEEGRAGALGVASSFGSGGKGVKGLVMDLGGGSVQLTGVVQSEDGVVSTCPQGALSFPYGAAALKWRLESEGGKGKRAERLRDEMKGEFQRAYDQLDIPGSLVDERGGLNLYLSGGGFRGWGYLLMSRATVSPYPIPIINGYKVSKEEFCDTNSVVSAASESDDAKVFGVSKRRASQIPAVALLVEAVVEALPMIKSIQFCNGGVREGYLFDKLPPEIRAQDPLVVATRPYASASGDSITDLLQSALPTAPSPTASSRPPDSFSSSLLRAVGNLLFAHSRIPKERRSAAALHSTTTGILASANNLTHADRVLIALVLSERWAGDLAPTDKTFQDRLHRCVTSNEVWWAQYLGRVGTMIGDIYPSGVVPETGWRLRLAAEWEGVATKEERCDVLVVRVEYNGGEGAVFQEALQEAGERIAKLGKKKKRQAGGERLRVTTGLAT